MNAPLPENEAARLEALRQCKILDTPAEKAFDDSTRLAAYICGTPIALVSLVDADRQWFKSKVGIDATEMPRDVAFCAHAILEPDVLIVPDALADKRFATNPLVTSDPHIRFYAGVPLIAASKYALGTLCVADYVPRELTPEQVEALRTLAHQVVRQVELRSNLADLERTTVEHLGAQKKRQGFFKKIAAGFVLASAILAGVGLVSYRSMTGLIKTSNEVIRSQAVLNSLEEVLSQMKDAEAGQRGYLLTGKESYLEPYSLAVEQVNPEVSALEKLAADNPKYQQQVNTLKHLIANKLVNLKETIDLRQDNGMKFPLQMTQSDNGNNLMYNIRKLIHEMELEETQLLTQRSHAAATSARNTIFTFSSGIFLNFVILAVVYYLIYSEIAERKRTEAALQQEQDFTSAVLDTSGALVVVLDSQERIVRFNHACEQTTDYSFAEVKGKYFWDLFLVPEEVEPVKATFKGLRAGQFPINQHENYLVTRKGDRRLIAWSNTALCDKAGSVEYVIGTGIDITERKQAEKQIKASLQEKEVLLKEIHHRVKNNLQIIYSLLNLQSGSIEEPKTLELLQSAQNRVASMALVHERLYQSEDLARINFADYIHNLAANLFSAYEIHSDAIALEINVDNVRLGVDAAIPCGLIINELVSNSLKYAFPPGKSGIICINIYPANDNYLTLTVSDNGIGFPKDLDWQNTESLGLQIVIALTNQLEGTIELNRNSGVEFKITFPVVFNI